MSETVSATDAEQMPAEARRKLVERLAKTQGPPLVVVLFGGKKDVWASNP